VDKSVDGAYQRKNIVSHHDPVRKKGLNNLKYSGLNHEFSFKNGRIPKTSLRKILICIVGQRK